MNEWMDKSINEINLWKNPSKIELSLIFCFVLFCEWRNWGLKRWRAWPASQDWGTWARSWASLPQELSSLGHKGSNSTALNIELLQGLLKKLNDFYKDFISPEVYWYLHSSATVGFFLQWFSAQVSLWITALFTVLGCMLRGRVPWRLRIWFLRKERAGFKSQLYYGIVQIWGKLPDFSVP